MTATLYCGNSLDVLPTLDASSVDAIVTDPPYGLGFMGKDWDHGVPGAHFWAEALRVAKPGAYLLAFGGTRTFHRLAVAIEDAGWELRDTIMWVYGTGFPKSLNIAKEIADEALAREWDGWGTALKPAWEPIIVARRPLVGTVARNVVEFGTGAINVEGCRIGGEDGRWPTNLIHDGGPDILDSFPHETDSRSAARFFYCAKASAADREEGLEGLPTRRDADREKVDGVGGDNPRNRTNKERRNHHPTVKPTELMRYLVRLVTRPGGTVLDCFMGSGSTGKAATLEGASFVGIDLSPEYVEIARARIVKAEADCKQVPLSLF